MMDAAGRVIAYFQEQDDRMVRERGGKVFDTTHGIFGTSDLRDMHRLFQDIDLASRKGFVDLGSGDGRIALLAALFTRSKGVEADTWLHAQAVAAKAALLPTAPALARCELVNGDYTTEDLSEADVFFIYADHAWDERFERYLSGRKGMLLSHQNIFAPRTLKKGKTFWVGQTPIVSYLLGE